MSEWIGYKNFMYVNLENVNFIDLDRDRDLINFYCSGDNTTWIMKNGKEFTKVCRRLRDLVNCDILDDDDEYAHVKIIIKDDEDKAYDAYQDYIKSFGRINLTKEEKIKYLKHITRHLMDSITNLATDDKDVDHHPV